MIEGTVNENYEATIRLTLRGVAREEREIEAIIDTGHRSSNPPNGVD